MGTFYYHLFSAIEKPQGLEELVPIHRTKWQSRATDVYIFLCGKIERV